MRQTKIQPKHVIERNNQRRSKRQPHARRAHLVRAQLHVQHMPMCGAAAGFFLFALKPHNLLAAIEHKIHKANSGERNGCRFFAILCALSRPIFLFGQSQINHALAKFGVIHSRRRRRLWQQTRLGHARQRVDFQHHRRTVRAHHHVHARIIAPADGVKRAERGGLNSLLVVDRVKICRAKIFRVAGVYLFL
jgi:hypothetical protein